MDTTKGTTNDNQLKNMVQEKTCVIDIDYEYQKQYI